MSEHKEFNDAVSISSRTAQIVHPLSKVDKSSALAYIIKKNSDSQTVVVTKTKKSADTLYKFLKAKEISVEVAHGNTRTDKKEKFINDYKSGELKVLITTDLILQYSELDNLDCIVSYDLPHDAEQYINRLECLSKSGISVVLYSIEDEKSLRAIEWLIKADIDKQEIEGYLPSAYNDEESIGKKDKIKKPRHKKNKKKNKLKESENEDENNENENIELT